MHPIRCPAARRQHTRFARDSSCARAQAIALPFSAPARFSPLRQWSPLRLPPRTGRLHPARLQVSAQRLVALVHSPSAFHHPSRSSRTARRGIKPHRRCTARGRWLAESTGVSPHRVPPDPPGGLPPPGGFRAGRSHGPQPLARHRRTRPENRRRCARCRILRVIDAVRAVFRAGQQEAEEE